MLPLAGVVTVAVVGFVLSSLKVVVAPVNVLPTLSVAVTTNLYVPSDSEVHVGSVTLLVQAAKVFPVVALCVVPRLRTVDCQRPPVCSDQS